MERKSKKRLSEKDVTVVDAKVAKQSVFGTALGNAMEWFDFGIYSYLAVIIGKVFFPEISGGFQLIYSFATFAVAFLARPIGGIVFGLVGDRLGRKKVLAITLIMMAASTLSIGLIPGYASIGIAAPILLLTARLLQGFSTGGEYAGAMTFIAESSPDKKRGFLASGLEVGTLIGYICGSGLVTILTLTLGSDTMLAWGWRIPFFVAAPLGLVGLYFRSKLEETPAFKKMQESEQEENKVSFVYIIKTYWKELLISMGIVLFFNTMTYFEFTYLPSYLTEQVGFGESKGLVIILFVMIVMIPFVILSGYLGDKIGRNKVIVAALIGVIALSIPSFMMFGTASIVPTFSGVLLLGIMCAAFEGVLPSLLPSLFFTKVRYGSLALTFNLSTSLFGGTAPLILAWLVKKTGNSMAPAYYLMVVCGIGLVVMLFFVKETAGRSLRGSKPAIEKKEELHTLQPKQALWWKEEIEKP
ncbi:proline-betaine transporter [Fictibacillus macauensis ZFHKF-1]|uniref:Putative proline/betaine transporter n=1 Tax=Fictibacillus macauensis ZFHKF-1 TaxID=1196324 RepID=I8UHV7_9BACL|nr:MFS transporter [Fictibacillus macauensis]EIT86455.1 proline-betaine transporter [Fictibacillus macauensis ZFHKF-1]